MNDLGGVLQRLIAAVSAQLGDHSEFWAFRDLLADLDGWLATSRAGADLPVVRDLGPALAAASGDACPLADLVDSLRFGLGYAQNPNYRAAPPSPDFLENYGYAVFAGPADGPPALIESPTLAFGLLLLGPHTEYPPHHHPATEIYIPLGPAEWLYNADNWRSRAPGDIIYHAPGVIHATRTGAVPLAALYLWRGDLATHARLK